MISPQTLRVCRGKTAAHFPGSCSWLLQCGNHLVWIARIAENLLPSSRGQGLSTSLSKNRTNFWTIPCHHGTDAEIRVPPVAVAGDDAAADAGHQAAAAVQSRSVGLCRGRAGAQSAAGARQ